MPRIPSHHRHHRLLLGLAVGLIFILSLLPPWMIGWISSFGNLTEKLVIPVQATVEGTGRWLVGRVRQRESDSPELEGARADAERFKTMYLQALEEKEQLLRFVASLKAGGELLRGLEVRQIVASVLGQPRGSNILKVRAGTNQGVASGDVAAFDGVHLIGKVASDVDPLFCRVVAITDAAAGGANLEGRGRITGAILPGETQALLPPDPLAERLICKLAPTGDGTLSGDVAYSGSRPDRPPLTVQAGAIVRLADDRWPPTAQMLILGTVKRVENKPNQRLVITVEPMWHLDAVREVYLRLPADRGGPGLGGAGTGGPAGGTP